MCVYVCVCVRECGKSRLVLTKDVRAAIISVLCQGRQVLGPSQKFVRISLYFRQLTDTE